jgi:hypothetical protein
MSFRRKALLSGCVLAAAIRVAIGITGIGQQSAKEAPAGFNTPSFNGAQSVSNGIAEPSGDTFALDQQIYEENHSVQTGLGPVYNATACVSCHENPNSGGAGQITELRVGHNDSYPAKEPAKRFAPNTNRVAVGNQILSFLEIASKDHIFPKVPISAKLHLVVAFYASTLTKKALDI